MLDLRDLECLIALARHKHFARAAEDCGMSQPAFSMRISGLEDRLETTIVNRGNRFQGFTTEGEIIVTHARTIIDQVRTLEQEVRAARGEVTGTLVLGVIPTAAAYAAHAANWLRRSHPEIHITIETANSLAIQQGVYNGRYDVGLTYTEGTSRDLLRVEPLYDEQYVLLAPPAFVPTDDTISWADAAALPLTLLRPEMQNRRIIDAVFAEVGAVPNVISETNGFIAAVVMALDGLTAVVAPKVLIDSLGDFDKARVLSLVDPVVEKSVSLVAPLRARAIPTVEAFREALSQFGQ